MLIGGYLFTSIILGLITNSINKKKGYGGGFLWGFLLNLIGLIIVAVRPYCQKDE